MIFAIFLRIRQESAGIRRNGDWGALGDLLPFFRARNRPNGTRRTRAERMAPRRFQPPFSRNDRNSPERNDVKTAKNRNGKAGSRNHARRNEFRSMVVLL